MSFGTLQEEDCRSGECICQEDQEYRWTEGVILGYLLIYQVLEKSNFRVLANQVRICGARSTFQYTTVWLISNLHWFNFEYKIATISTKILHY